MVLAFETALVAMSDRVVFSRVSDTYPGFLYKNRPHVSAEDGADRRCSSARRVYCDGYYASTVCLNAQNTFWKAQKETKTLLVQWLNVN